MPRMHVPTLATVSVTIATIAAPALAEDAVQWRVKDGGNGHWYQRVTLDAEKNFEEARQVAVAIGADLASVASQDEDEFVAALAEGAIGRGVIIGTKVTDPDCNVFTWTDGSAWTYENWGPNQPNCFFGEAIGYEEGGWHDLGWFDIEAAMFEWSDDCNEDGIVDYGQILDGTFEDADGNGIPDDCETMNVAGYEAAVMASGPIAYWRMGIKQGVVANHVAGAPAAVADGSPTVDETAVGCVEDGSLRMNGNSHLVVPDDDRFDLGVLGDFSVEAWVRLPALDDEMIVSRSRDVNAGNWDLRTYGNPGNLLLEIRLTYIAYAATEWRPEWTDQWIHVVGTADDSAGTLSLYVNGALESEVELEGPIAGSSNYPLLIGRHNIRGTYAWNAIGSIDEVAIYDRPLGADEVLAHFVSADPSESCDMPCIGDLNGDGFVDAADLGILLAFWGTDGTLFPGTDIDENGLVNAADLGLVLGAWGPCEL